MSKEFFFFPILTQYNNSDIYLVKSVESSHLKFTNLTFGISYMEAVNKLDRFQNKFH